MAATGRLAFGQVGKAFGLAVDPTGSTVGKATRSVSGTQGSLPILARPVSYPGKDRARLLRGGSNEGFPGVSYIAFSLPSFEVTRGHSRF